MRIGFTKMADQGDGARQLRREGDEFYGRGEVFGAVEGFGRRGGGRLEEGSVVCTFLGGVEIRSFAVGAEQGGARGKRACFQRGKDLSYYVSKYRPVMVCSCPRWTKGWKAWQSYLPPKFNILHRCMGPQGRLGSSKDSICSMF